MAAPSASVPTDALQPQVVVKTESESENDTSFMPIIKRDPVVTLMSPLCGLQPLRWAQDHRIAASTTNAVSVIELVCDFQNNKQDLTLHRTSIPVSREVLQLQVGPENELAKAKEKFASHPDPAVSQLFMADRVVNPTLGGPKGIKYTSWSPLGCDASGRCLLACLTLDHRLTIQTTLKRLEWSMLADLTQLYNKRLEERGYSRTDGRRPTENLLNIEELNRRFCMQTPLRMEWSSIYTVKHVEANNTIKDVEMVLLAALMENGDLVLWRFFVPFARGDDVTVYAVIESGVTQPSDLAWWEYETPERRMSGLILGSEVGPVKILPVSLSGVKGYFTLRHPVVLWKERDEIHVENIKCVPIYHPIHKCNCSLVVASRGCYLFWCMLMISPAGLNVHNAHVAGLHSLPIVSIALSRPGVAVFTCSMDGAVKKLTPSFSDKTLFFKQEVVLTPDSFPGQRMLCIAISHNGAFLALATTQGLVNGHHPVEKTYQVNFVSLKTSDAALALLLKSPSQNMYKLADLLDLVRWRVVKDKRIPQSLTEELDKKIQESDCSLFFWRVKLFLARILHRSMQKAPEDPRWKPSRRGCKVFIAANEEEEEEGENEDEEEQEEEAAEEEEGGGGNGKNAEDRMAELQASIEALENHLIREHMKKVLGEVYLNIRTAVNTSIPTCGIADYLSQDSSDKSAEVLIGHIKKKMNKQTFPEYCSLCKEVLPFTDNKQATCKNGHMWLRCALSYQACQSVTFRRCLLLDSIAALPEPGDPEWIQKILHGTCMFCDSPTI